MADDFTYQETMVAARLLNRAERRARRDKVVVVPVEPRVQQVYLVDRAGGAMPNVDAVTKAERQGLANIDRAEQRALAARKLLAAGATHAVIDVVGQKRDEVLDLEEVAAVDLDFDAMRASVRSQAAQKRLTKSGALVLP